MTTDWTGPERRDTSPLGELCRREFSRMLAGIMPTCLSKGLGPDDAAQLLRDVLERQTDAAVRRALFGDGRPAP